jgi:hypothetical protein
LPPGWPPKRYPNPVPTVDLVMEYRDQDLLLIERPKPPLGWALSGGFGDYGESLEAVARREGKNPGGEPFGAIPWEPSHLFSGNPAGNPGL